MTKNKLALMLVGLLLMNWLGVNTAARAWPLPPVSVFVEFNAFDLASAQSAVAKVEAHGGICVHRFLPGGCIGELPEEQDKALLAEPEIANLYRGTVDGAMLTQTGKSTSQSESLDIALLVWNAVFVNLPPETMATETEQSTSGQPPPPPDDALWPPDLPGLAGADAAVSSTSPSSPGYYQTSEFMIGDVAVGIILPESDGSGDPSSENWSTTRQDEVVLEIVSALNWWAARAGSAGLLTFTYRVERSVPTRYEPITHPQSEEGLWIKDVLGRLGYSASDYFTRARDYVNDLRSQYETDWAFAVLVADDLNDVDNYFAPHPTTGSKYFAYAYLGGPFMVMTYGNDGYGPGNMDAVMAHEMGHIFLAVDGYAGSSSCTSYSGYLNAQNSNSLNPSTDVCGAGVSCIMRGQISPYTSGAVSVSSRYQIGWRDSDGDGIPDPVDTEVELSLWSASPQSSPSGLTWGIAGYALDHPWDSPTRPDVTINGVELIQYRVDGGNWQNAACDDGFCDGPSESFSFDIGPLSEKSHIVTVRAADSMGNELSYNLQISPPGFYKVYLPLVLK